MSGLSHDRSSEPKAVILVQLRDGRNQSQIAELGLLARIRRLRSPIGACQSEEERLSHVILVVEDEPLLRVSAIEMIEDAGFVAVSAANSTDAISILESRPDIRLVFTDVDMPGGMDGVHLAALVRDRWPPIRLIVTSGHRHVTQDMLPEAAVFFNKPYDETVVVETMHRLAA